MDQPCQARRIKLDTFTPSVLTQAGLEIAFSDGTVGARDFAEIKTRTGEMVAPLKDADYFARVFIEDGAFTWPNGYDWDPIALHDEMKAKGLLRRVDAAE
jgi:hypothetical protein